MKIVIAMLLLTLSTYIMACEDGDDCCERTTVTNVSQIREIR